jgi:O-6-methylguanine DNA methyltransferase
MRQLAAYFAGNLKAFNIPLDIKGTEFQKRVWAALLTIPFGETRSYGQIARQIGHPAAVRAVGTANDRNPISIVAPCHRVVGASGALTGFAGGLDAKRYLLDLEAPGRHDGHSPNAMPSDNFADLRLFTFGFLEFAVGWAFVVAAGFLRCASRRFQQAFEPIPVLSCLSGGSGHA